MHIVMHITRLLFIFLKPFGTMFYIFKHVYPFGYYYIIIKYIQKSQFDIQNQYEEV